MRLGLGQRLNITIIAAFVFFCIIFMTINLIYFWRESNTTFDSKINYLADFSAKTNSENIWNFDTKNINVFINSLLNEKSLIGIIFEFSDFNKEKNMHLFYGSVSGKIINENSTNIESIEPERKTFTRHIERSITHENIVVGKVHLYFSDKYIFGYAIDEGKRFLFNLTIFLLLYSLAIYFLIKKQLLNPLKDIHQLALGVSGLTFYLNESVSQERWANIQQLLDIEKLNQRKLQEKKRNDELGDFTETFFLVLTGFELIISELSQYSEQLQIMNDDLEARIFHRTAQLEDSHKKVSESLHALQQTKNQLAQQEKLASIGQLAAGVAHEINNPIGYVGSNINRLAEYFNDLKHLLLEMEKMVANLPIEIAATIKLEFEKIKNNIDYEFLIDDFGSVISESQEGIKRIKDIVQSLKDFSHNVDEHNFSEVDINEAIRTTLKVINNELKYCCDVNVDLQLQKLVPANLGQIHQVVSNIIINASHAIKATEIRGKLTIRTFSDESFAYIDITDTGGGIPEHIRSKVFDPFFTTKPIGQGTGLGLNICYDIIVNKHEGVLSFESQLGSGTTFTIKLPLLAATPSDVL